MKETNSEAHRTEAVLSRALEYLISQTAAARAAVFSIVDGHWDLVDSRRINQESLDRVAAEMRFTDLADETRKVFPRENHTLLLVHAPAVRYVFYFEKPQRSIPSADSFATHLSTVLAKDCHDDNKEGARGRIAAERSGFEELLRYEEWNVARSARRLGVSRTTAYRWLRRYGIKRPCE